MSTPDVQLALTANEERELRRGMRGALLSLASADDDDPDRTEALVGIVGHLGSMDVDDLTAWWGAVDRYATCMDGAEQGVVYRLLWWIGNGMA